MDKRIAPTIWALITIACILFYAAAFVSVDSLVVCIAGIVLATGLIGAIIAVLRERYKEIEEGEEDDLDNY